MDFINKVKLPISYYALNDNWEFLDRDVKANIVMRYIDDIELEFKHNRYEVKRITQKASVGKNDLLDYCYSYHFDKY